MGLVNLASGLTPTKDTKDTKGTKEKKGKEARESVMESGKIVDSAIGSIGSRTSNGLLIKVNARGSRRGGLMESLRRSVL